MGFWDIAGEFAKEFGKGYMKERGVKGTLEDISELFSSDDDDDDDEKEFDEQVWSDTVDEINSCIEAELYDDAIDTLVNYYKEYEDSEPDFYYYYYYALILTDAYTKMASDDPEIKDAEKNISDIFTEAYYLKPTGDTKKSLVELNNAFTEEKKRKKREVEEFGKLMSEIENDKKSGRYTQAWEKLNWFYSADRTKDFFYYYQRYLIAKERCESGSGSKFFGGIQVEINECVKGMKRFENDDNREYIEEAEKMYDTIKVVYIRNLVEDFIASAKYEEARKLILSTLAGKISEKNRLMSRVDSIELVNEIDAGGVTCERLESLILRAEQSYNAAMETEKDIQLKSKILDAVLPRIHRGKALLVQLKSDVIVEKNDSIKAVTGDKFTDAESEYLEEVKSCLADDGVITERERRLLDRLAKSLGITEMRAQELEASCSCNNLTTEEQEYADEVKACLADDGVITERERRLLDRLRKSLGISESRAAELEKTMA